MNFIHENGRIYLKENGEVKAELDYKKINEDTYDIYHTFVSEKLRGQGIASKLMEEAVNTINGKIIPSCAYAKKWFDKNKK